MNPRALPALALATLALALGACQNEPEEGPGLEEAIPVDEPEDTVGVDMPIEDSMPEPTEGMDTMESGSNPPTMTPPPPGSKVQPAD